MTPTLRPELTGFRAVASRLQESSPPTRWDVEELTIRVALPSLFQSTGDSSAGRDPRATNQGHPHVTAVRRNTGLLPCTHGDRLLILYGPGVAALEVAPLGAVL
jgi:hypothetical protein